MRLADVQGHPRIQAILRRALERDRVPPALLLTGPEGVGKKTLALAVAQAVLCERAPAGEACGECRTCRWVAAAITAPRLEELRREADGHSDEDVWRNFRIHPDLVLVEGWWLTKTGRPRSEPEIRIAQVRDLVREIAGVPFEARRRVFVIDDAHTINDEAQNALLKSLEEPPRRSHIVLVTSVPLGLRQTIRSRCQTLRFGPLPRGTVSAVLQERGLPEEEARLRAGLAGGSVGAALAFESEEYREVRQTLLSLLESIDGMNTLDRIAAAETLEQLPDGRLLATVLRSLLRDVAVARAGAPASALVNADVADRLAVLAGTPLGERAAAAAEHVSSARRALRGFGNRALVFEVLVDALAGD
jgi:DNA polymerase III subunit delta'